MTQTPTHIPPLAQRAAVVLIAAQIFLTAMYALNVRDLPGTRQFDMDGELNVPTWWSASLFLVAGLAALGLARCNALTGRPVAPWTLVGIGLFGLSLEEIAGIHEQVGVALGGGTEGVSVWPLAYAPFAVVGVWLLMKAVRDLPRPFAILGICGLSCYVLVLGVELSALLGEDAVTLAIEENLELLGTGAILIALGSELINRFGTLFVRTTERAATAPADVAAVVGAAPSDGIAAPAMPR
jgi:hypothetical protein